MPLWRTTERRFTCISISSRITWIFRTQFWISLNSGLWGVSGLFFMLFVSNWSSRTHFWIACDSSSDKLSRGSVKDFGCTGISFSNSCIFCLPALCGFSAIGPGFRGWLTKPSTSFFGKRRPARETFCVGRTFMKVAIKILPYLKSTAGRPDWMRIIPTVFYSLLSWRKGVSDASGTSITNICPGVLRRTFHEFSCIITFSIAATSAIFNRLHLHKNANMALMKLAGIATTYERLVYMYNTRC